MTTTLIIDRCDLTAHEVWSRRRVAPAYMRGMPSWVWQTALGPSGRQQRRPSGT